VQPKICTIHINNSEIGFRGLFYVPVVLVSRGIAQKHFFDKKKFKFFLQLSALYYLERAVEIINCVR
jgi:hypothetical protein